MALRSWVIQLIVFGVWNLAAGVEIEGSTPQNLRGLQEEPNQRQKLPQRAPRIINGQDVLSFRYPYFSLMYRPGMCGGVLISPTLVLSAAHCDGASDLFRVGAYADTSDGDHVGIRSAIIHPEYEEADFDMDVMIFQLDKKSSNPYIKLNKEEIKGGTFTVLGFGDTDKGSPLELAGNLQEVELHYVDNKKCDKGHGGNGEVTEDMMCVTAVDKDSCVGDSGGPLLIKGETPEEDSLVGIVSWGRECASEERPGVYARMSYFYDWIVETVCTRFPNDAPPYMECSALNLDQNFDQNIEPTFPESDPTENFKTRKPSSTPTRRPSPIPTRRPSFTPTRRPTHKPSPSPPPEPLCATVGDLCANDDFSIFCGLLAENNLVDTVTSGKWNIFAPTNKAFTNVLPVLSTLRNEAVINVLKFHLASGADAITLECKETIEMVSGRDSRTLCNRSGRKFQIGGDNREANTFPEFLSEAEPICGGGVYYIMSEVLLPDRILDAEQRPANLLDPPAIMTKTELDTMNGNTAGVNMTHIHILLETYFGRPTNASITSQTRENESV